MAAQCPIPECDQAVYGTGPTDMQWAMYDHLTLDHGISHGDADAIAHEEDP